MKRSNNFLEEQFLKEPQRSFANRNLKDHPLLVFVTDPNLLEIRYTNLRTRSYLGNENSFKKWIHPADYHDFILHLRSLESLTAGAKEEVVARARVDSKTWKKYLFTHRIYHSSGTSKERLLLVIAKELKSLKKKRRLQIFSPGLQKSFAGVQNKYRSLISAMDEAFCIMDPLYNSGNKPVDFLFLEANAAFEQHLKMCDVTFKTVKEVVPDFEDRWLQNCTEVANKRQAVRFRSFAENLGESCFTVHAFPIEDDETGLVGAVFSEVSSSEQLRATTDLTGRIIQQERPKENHELLSAFLEDMKVGIAVLEPVYEKKGVPSDFVYLHANTTICEQYGKSVVGKRFNEIVSTDEADVLFRAFEQTILHGERQELEVKSRKKEQENCYKITTKRENKLLIVSRENISGRKRKARRFKESVRFRKQIAEISPDIIMILNLKEDNVRYINRNLGAHRAMRKKEIDGMSLERIIPFIHPYDRAEVLQFHSTIPQAKDKEILDIEFRLKIDEEHWEWFRARGKVFMRDKRRNVCEFILLLRNVEQQKRTQKALLHAEKLSIQGEVAKTLAHELRNPMASIGMAADILAQKTAGKKISEVEMSNYIGVIKRSTGILNDLVTDLLNSSNYSPMAPTKCCLAETLEQALKAASDRIYLTGVQVIKDYHGTYEILADQEKLKIALLNIIVNASEAMKSDERIITLKIVRNTNDHCLTITDNGRGMKKSQLDKLFDAFYTQKPHGVGIGLSSVKNILEDHGARILVESKLNEGTSFHLTFHGYGSFQRT